MTFMIAWINSQILLAIRLFLSCQRYFKTPPTSWLKTTNYLLKNQFIRKEEIMKKPMMVFAKPTELHKRSNKMSPFPHIVLTIFFFFANIHQIWKPRPALGPSLLPLYFALHFTIDFNQRAYPNRTLGIRSISHWNKSPSFIVNVNRKAR